MARQALAVVLLVALLAGCMATPAPAPSGSTGLSASPAPKLQSVVATPGAQNATSVAHPGEWVNGTYLRARLVNVTVDGQNVTDVLELEYLNASDVQLSIAVHVLPDVTKYEPFADGRANMTLLVTIPTNGIAQVGLSVSRVANATMEPLDPAEAATFLWRFF